ncbi:xanthine dehydrogenase accessory protein XdhC [bacterium DOLJORAL78_65_58]|nr:MAG: xanthine dehydrogenase accessory protein XdhC [bacterium DOLZORAL124_64_63]PIE75851.1 MAG: xanthine dehydrogenase accessory protein XdhC [bacterium DOLJORAL78_65_58]
MNAHPIHDTEIFAELAAMVREGRPGVLATVIAAAHSTPRSTGSKMIVHADGSVTGSIGGGKGEKLVMEKAPEVLADGVCRRVDLDLAGEQGICGGSMEVFLEPVLREYPCLVIGAGHLGRALLELGRTLPLRFTLVDDRSEYLAPWEAESGVRALEREPGALGNDGIVPVGGAVILASRGHELDSAYLEAYLKAERDLGQRAAYVGVVGSRAKARRIRRDLESRAPACAERLAQVRMPVGLDLGDEAPAEIALSIFAEILAVLRGVEPLRDETGEALGYSLRARRSSKGGK